MVGASVPGGAEEVGVGLVEPFELVVVKTGFLKDDEVVLLMGVLDDAFELGRGQGYSTAKAVQEAFFVVDVLVERIH